MFCRLFGIYIDHYKQFKYNMVQNCLPLKRWPCFALPIIKISLPENLINGFVQNRRFIRCCLNLENETSFNYNTDKSALFYKALPRGTLTYRKNGYAETTVPFRTISIGLIRFFCWECRELWMRSRLMTDLVINRPPSELNTQIFQKVDRWFLPVWR